MEPYIEPNIEPNNEPNNEPNIKPNIDPNIQGDHFELSQKLKKITFKEKRICQAAIVHIVDVFSPFDNNTPISLNAS